MTSRHNISSQTIKAMWNNWAMAVCAPAIVLVAAMFMSKQWLPLVPFTIAYLLTTRLKFESNRKKIMGCNIIVWVMAWIMLWTAIIMCSINLIYAKWFLTGLYHIDPINAKHPFVTPLVIFSTSTIVSLYFMLRGRNSSHCRRCMARFGYYDNSDKRIAELYFRESQRQLRMLITISLIISIVDWFYYYKFYINVNVNTPDRFFFIFLPLAILTITFIYMTVRYMTLADEQNEKASTKSKQQLMTLVRYLMLSNDTLCLSLDSDGYLDTPAKTIIPRRESLTDKFVAETFSNMSGTSNFTTKYLYSDTGFAGGYNVFHYAVFINPSEVANLHIDGAWQTIDQLDRQLKAGNLAPELMSELHRIYRVTMAWKTYDREGKRLYPIKNYQPTFRLRDLSEWEVDYDDHKWLDIAANNQDRPFFKLRRFFRRNFKH